MDSQDESPVKHHKAQQQGCERTSASGLATAGQSVRIAETLLAGSVGHDKGGKARLLQTSLTGKNLSSKNMKKLNMPK